MRWYASRLILEVVTSAQVVLRCLHLGYAHRTRGSSGLIEALLTLPVLHLRLSETLLEAESTRLNAQLVANLLALTFSLETVIGQPGCDFVGARFVEH